MSQMDGRKNGWMDNVKTVYPPQTYFVGGIKIHTPFYTQK